MKSILQNQNEPALIIDSSYAIIETNEKFLSKFKLKDKNLTNRSILQIKNAQWNFPEFKSLLSKLSARKQSIENYKVIHYFEEIGLRSLIIDIKNIDIEGTEIAHYLIRIKDVTSKTDSGEILSWIEKKLKIINNLGEIFSTASFKQIFRQTRKQIIKSLGCEYCLFGYLDTQGNIIIAGENNLDKQGSYSSGFSISKQLWNSQFGSEVLEERNFPDKIKLELPKGKITIYNSLNMPISHKDEEIGRILVLNKPGDFNQLDKNLLTAIVSYIAPLLYDKLTIKKMKQNQQQLKAVINESKIKVKEAIEIDEIDEQILTGLYKDGNITLQDLSKTVIKSNGESMSGTGVKKRIKKLKKRNILKVQGNVNLEKLDYKLVYYLVNLKDYGNIEKIQELKNDCSRIFLVSRIMGKYHLLLGFYGRDIEEVCKCINNCGILNEVIDKKNSDLFRILNLGVPTFYPVKVIGEGGNCENCRFYKTQNP